MALFATQLDWLTTEELATGVWTQKSGGGCPALAVIRQNGEVALFATQLDWLMTEELATGVWTQKSENGRSAPADLR